MAVRPLSQRPLDWLFLVYFIIHIPITICIDMQIIFPSSYFHPFLTTALSNWVRDYDDVLTGSPPLWYRSFIWIELFVHLPYFFLAIYAFVKGKEWIRNLTLLYSMEVIGAMVAIIPEAWTRSHAPINTKLGLMSVLAIWCVLPVMLIARVWSEKVFEEKNGSGAGKKNR